jgi:hypothetical protein
MNADVRRFKRWRWEEYLELKGGSDHDRQTMTVKLKIKLNLNYQF